jgi:uncharacterized protein YdaU (DUF1376 family)
MAKFRALMLWTDAWIADTYHLTREQRGTYMDLLILMWRTAHFRVPNDDFWLAKHMRMSMSEVRNELKPLIKEFCRNDGNYITQKRLLRESREARSQSARAKSRWHNKKGDAETHATVTVTSNRISKEEGASRQRAHARRSTSNFKTIKGGRSYAEQHSATAAIDRLLAEGAQKVDSHTIEADYVRVPER